MSFSAVYRVLPIIYNIIYNIISILFIKEIRDISGYQSELSVLLNKPVHIFPSTNSYMYMSYTSDPDSPNNSDNSNNTNSFKMMNHYIPHSSKIHDSYILNSQSSGYDLFITINNQKQPMCIQNNKLSICSQPGRLDILNSINQMGYILKYGDRCLTVSNGSIDVERCADGAEEQVFDFKPVRVLECSGKYQRKDSVSNNSGNGICECLLKGCRMRKEKDYNNSKCSDPCKNGRNKEKKEIKYTSNFNEDCPICQVMHSNSNDRRKRKHRHTPHRSHIPHKKDKKEEIHYIAESEEQTSSTEYIYTTSNSSEISYTSEIRGSAEFEYYKPEINKRKKTSRRNKSNEKRYQIIETSDQNSDTDDVYYIQK